MKPTILHPLQAWAGAGAFAQTLPALLFARAADGRQLYVNDEWLRRTGAPTLQALEGAWGDFVDDGGRLGPPAGADGHWCQRVRLRGADHSWASYEIDARREPDGSWVGSLSRVEPAVPGGMDSFLASVSHELRAPLNAVRGWAHLLRQSVPAGPMTTRALDAIERNVVVQARLIDDLRDHRNLLDGSLQLDRRRLPLMELIDEVIDSFAPTLSAKQLTLSVNHFDPSAQVDVDAARIRQVLANLLSNAAKFTPSGGHVDVRSCLQSGCATIEVADTGIGFEPGSLEQAFEPFRRSDAQDGQGKPALGLGLSLAQRLVSLHGGMLQARSEGPGRGTTFVIDLPVCHGARGEADDDRPAVVVVDDDPQTRELVSTLLGSDALHVLPFSNAREAYAYLRDASGDAQPRLLVSDIGMPEEDGYSFIRRVRGLPQGTLPALALTAFTSMTARAEARAAGFDAYLGKPFDPQELMVMVHRLLDGTHAHSARA